MLLYHGSYTEVPEPDLKKCAKFKDFGRGFYLTSSHAQAMSFSRLSLRKARENGIVPSSQMHGCVSVFRASLRGEPNVKVLVFPTAGVAWLKCVAAHRREGAFPEDLEELADYDIIVGKVANDPTNNTLVTFLSGGYGSLQSK